MSVLDGLSPWWLQRSLGWGTGMCFPPQWTQASNEKSRIYRETQQSSHGKKSAKIVNTFSQGQRALMKFVTFVIVQDAFLWPCLPNKNTPQSTYVQHYICKVNCKQITEYVSPPGEGEKKKDKKKRLVTALNTFLESPQT